MFKKKPKLSESPLPETEEKLGEKFNEMEKGLIEPTSDETASQDDAVEEIEEAGESLILSVKDNPILQNLSKGDLLRVSKIDEDAYELIPEITEEETIESESPEEENREEDIE